MGTDYIHLKNMIMKAVQRANETMLNERKSMINISEFVTLIEFLEEMYVASVISLSGTLLTMVKHSPDAEFTTKAMKTVKSIMLTPKDSVPLALMEAYAEMIEKLNLPDALTWDEADPIAGAVSRAVGIKPGACPNCGLLHDLNKCPERWTPDDTTAGKEPKSLQ